MSVNIRIFPDKDYEEQNNAVLEKANELLKAKKEQAYTDNPNISAEQLEKIRIRPFASNGKFALREDLLAGRDYTWNFWVGRDDNGNLIFTLQVKDSTYKKPQNTDGGNDINNFL